MKKEVKINGSTIQLHTYSDADESVFNEIMIERDYKILDDLIKSTPYPIIDIGAHIGVFTAYCRSLNTEVPILCIEPDQRNFEILKKNIKTNNFKNIIVKQIGIADKQGPQTLYINEDSHNHSIIPQKDQNFTDKKEVYCTTLENITKKYFQTHKKIALLKMDCEGAEFQIIESTPIEILQKFQTIYIEYHEISKKLQSQEIVKKLKSAGFKVRKTPSHYHKKMGFILAKH
ncbi:FkbM family methyltransferase [Patescibacteria group bacterium]